MKNRYLHGPAIDQVLAEETFDSMGLSDEVYWQLADNLGSIRDVVTYDDSTDTATVVKHLAYSAFGNITSDSNMSIDVRFAYTGREFDIETGLYYYRARYYDADNGRFISEDPIGFWGGDENLVSYVVNLPTYFTDPSGEAAYVGGRDLDITPSLIGTHSILIFVPDNPAGYRGLVQLGVDENGNPIMGFTIAGHNVDGCLKPLFNQKADTEAVKEIFDRSQDGGWGPDYSAELVRRLKPPKGPDGKEISDNAFARLIIEKVTLYNENTEKSPIGYQMFFRNCNHWLASLLDSMGIDDNVDTWGWDPGNDNPKFKDKFEKKGKK